MRTLYLALGGGVLTATIAALVYALTRPKAKAEPPTHAPLSVGDRARVPFAKVTQLTMLGVWPPPNTLGVTLETLPGSALVEVVAQDADGLIGALLSADLSSSVMNVPLPVGLRVKFKERDVLP